jgi:hypothetical protein
LTTEQPSATGITDWHDLYRAALRETDQKKILARIVMAEQALVDRDRELFAVQGGSTDEAQAIDDACYALNALRNCLKLRTRDEAA